jgi:hypothetical protein
MGKNLTVCSHLRRAVPTVPPLASAKVLRADASVPTRRRSSRATWAGASGVATASASSQGAAEASGPQPVASPSEPQPTAAEEWRAPVVVEAQRAAVAAEARPKAEAQPAAPVAAGLPAASVVEGHPVPAAAETWPEAVAVVPQQEPATAEARSDATVGAQQEPALACSSRAMAVEIPDDDAPPPGWDQWGEPTHAVPRILGGGAREAVGRPHGGRGPRARRRDYFFPRRPLCFVGGARWRAARLRRRPGGAVAVGGAP